MNSSEPTAFDQLMSEGMAASHANDSAQAIECFTKAIEARPTAGLPHFLLGSEFAAQGNVDQAEAALANATLLAPDLHIARYQLGLLQFSSGRAAVALFTWRPLLALPAVDPLPHFVEGYASLAQDRFEEALAHFREGILLNKTNPALSEDIEKVVARIHGLGYRLSTEEAAGSQARALLAKFQQPGLAH